MLHNVSGLLWGCEVEIFGGGLEADGRKKKGQEVTEHQGSPGRGSPAKGIKGWTGTWEMQLREKEQDGVQGLCWGAHIVCQFAPPHTQMHMCAHITADTHRHTRTGSHADARCAMSSPGVKAERKAPEASTWWPPCTQRISQAAPAGIEFCCSRACCSHWRETESSDQLLRIENQPLLLLSLPHPLAPTKHWVLSSQHLKHCHLNPTEEIEIVGKTRAAPWSSGPSQLTCMDAWSIFFFSLVPWTQNHSCPNPPPSWREIFLACKGDHVLSLPSSTANSLIGPVSHYMKWAISNQIQLCLLCSNLAWRLQYPGMAWSTLPSLCIDAHPQFVPLLGFPGGSDGKGSACNAGDPGSGRSPGEGNGYLLQYSWLENSMDSGAWWAIVHGVTNSWTWLNG